MRHVIGIALCVLAPGAWAAPLDVAGVWAVDVERSQSRDVYGELRVLRQSEEALEATLVDFGIAWVDGAYRGVVNVRPWIFRFGEWGPRRGPSDSKQPRTIARSMGDLLVLAKSTSSGSGGFVWIWDLDDATGELVQTETGRSSSADLDARSAGGKKSRFRRAVAADFTAASFGGSGARIGDAEIVPTEIVVRVNDDATGLVLRCPQQACVITRIENGARRSSRALPLGEAAMVDLDSELLIEPATAPP